MTPDTSNPAWQAASMSPASPIGTTSNHTGEEPFRIVAEPPVLMPGATMSQRRANAIDNDNVKHLRAVLCSEPRGHADMYGGLVVPPDDDGADLGMLFWYKDGFLDCLRARHHRPRRVGGGPMPDRGT